MIKFSSSIQIFDHESVVLFAAYKEIRKVRLGA